MNLLSFLLSFSLLFHFLFILYLLCRAYAILYYSSILFSIFVLVLNLKLNILNCLNFLSHNFIGEIHPLQILQGLVNTVFPKFLHVLNCFLCYFLFMGLILKNSFAAYKIFGSHFLPLSFLQILLASCLDLYVALGKFDNS